MSEFDNIEIFSARHSSANARAKYIRVDCYTGKEGEDGVRDLVRFRVPFEIRQTPDGPQVSMQYEEMTVVENDREREIRREEVPERVLDKVQELRREIGNW